VHSLVKVDKKSHLPHDSNDATRCEDETERPQRLRSRITPSASNALREITPILTAYCSPHRAGDLVFYESSS